MDVTYLGDLRCEAVHGPSGSVLRTDAPVDNQGRGELFSPTDLVATALGSCLLTIMGIVARRHGLELAGARARVAKEMSTTPPRRIARLTVTLDIPPGVPDDVKPLLEHALRACPVLQSLHPEIDETIEFHWDSPEAV